MNEIIRVYAEGSAFENGIYELRAMDHLIAGYRLILDRLAIIHLRKEGAINPKKEWLRYDTKVEEGSIDLLVSVSVDPELVKYLANGFVLSRTLAKIYGDAMSLIRAMQNRDGSELDIRVKDSFNDGSNNVTVSVENSVIVVSDPEILLNAKAIQPSVSKLVKQIDGENIKHIDLVSGDNNFSLTQNDKNLSECGNKLVSAKVRIIGHLNVLDSTKKSGEIVSKSGKLPVTWEGEMQDKIKTIELEKVKLFTVSLIDKKFSEGAKAHFSLVSVSDL